MKKVVYFLILVIFFAACKQKAVSQNDRHLSDKKALMAIDKAFSAMSAEKGMKTAFVEYIDSNGVLLRPKHLPIVGARAIDFLIEQNDTEYTLTWEPDFAEAAASGELGYTYGIYRLHLNTTDTTIYGTYVSIWKKQQDGKWKFVLDTGNENIGSE